MMKTIYTLILLLFCTLAFAQTDRAVNKIRQAVEQINKDTGHTTKTLDNEQFLEHMTDGGGKLTGYFKNGRLVKIVEWIGLSSCINITEYYLQDNKLIFAYTQGSVFPYVDSLGTFDHYGKLALTMECRYYFKNGKMIKSILHGSTMCSGQPSDSWAKQYQDECLRYLKLLKAK